MDSRDEENEDVKEEEKDTVDFHFVQVKEKEQLSKTVPQKAVQKTKVPAGPPARDHLKTIMSGMTKNNFTDV